MSDEEQDESVGDDDKWPCPECGEGIDKGDFDDGDLFFCPHCGEVL